MRNSCVPALALFLLFSGAMHCSGQSTTGPVSVRGSLMGAPAGSLASYSVELADLAGSTPHEYVADADPSGHFEIPSVGQGNYTYRVRNHLGEVVQTGFVRVDDWLQELNIFVPARPNKELPAGGTISARRLAHRPVKAAKKEFLKGQSAAGKGDRVAALRHYARAVEIDPKWYEPRVNYGAQLFVAGRTANALIQARAAIDIDPASVEGYINASAVLSTMGKYPEAAQAAARAVELAPQLAKSRYLLGFALLGLSRVNEAVDHLRRVESFGPARELLERISATKALHTLADSGR
jgi:tetratricopeptide (TPR) repeat protein